MENKKERRLAFADKGKSPAIATDAPSTSNAHVCHVTGNKLPHGD
jgi:hypothetical protein